MAFKYLDRRYWKILWRSVGAVFLLVQMSRRLRTGVPRSIVIINNVQLGDMVCATPVFRALKQRFPQTKLLVVGSKINGRVLEGNTDIDEYIVLDATNADEISRRLRKEQIEAGIILVPSLDSLLLLAFARTSFIVAPRLSGGWSPANTMLYRFLAAFVVTRPHHMGSYAPREYLRMIEPFNIHTSDTTKHLTFTPHADKKIISLLNAEGIEIGGVNTKGSFVCITPAAGNKVKEWPPERFAKVAAYIWKTYKLPIVILGTKVDEVEVEKMIAALNPEIKYVNTVEKLSLDDLKAMISRARLLIGVDTGPIYIAEAFNTELIDITGPIDPNEQPPRGEGRIIVTPPLPYKPVMHVLNARVFDREEARRQAESITVEMVTAAVDTLLS